MLHANQLKLQLHLFDPHICHLQLELLLLGHLCSIVLSLPALMVLLCFLVIVTIFLLFHNLFLLVCSRRIHILFGMCKYDYVSLLLVVHPFHLCMIVL